MRGRKDKGTPELRNKFLIVNNRKKFRTLSSMGQNMLIRRLLEQMGLENNEQNIKRLKNGLTEKKE